MAFCGGVGAVKQPDDSVTEILLSIRPELEKRVGKTFKEYIPVHFKTQVVNGVNYFIKIRVDVNDFVHVRVYKTFQGEIHVHGVQENMTADQEVSFF